MLASIFIKAYCELLLVVCLVLHVFYFCDNIRLQCLPPFWQEATMNFYLLFELYCKLFVFATTLDFIANLHLHRTIASYRTDAFLKLLQVSTITSFSFFSYFVCCLCSIASSLLMHHYQTPPPQNTTTPMSISIFFKLQLSPHLEQFLSCNLQGFFSLPSSLLLVSWSMSTSLLPL